MAFSTDTVVTANDMIADISAFLVGQCGWSLVDDIATGNKVFHSTGKTGDRNIYLRFQSGVKDRNQIPGVAYWQNQEHPGALYDHVNVFGSQYWNTPTHAGVNALSGKIGPWGYIWKGTNVSNAWSTAFMVDVYPGNTSSIFAHKHNGNVPNTTTEWLSNYAGVWAYGGYYAYLPHLGPIIANTGYLDSKNMNFNNIQRKVLVVDNRVMIEKQLRPVFAYDAAGVPNIFVAAGQTVTGIPTRWGKTNLQTGAFTALATPPPGAVVYGNASLCWDGGNFIYMNQSNAVGFYRYDISANTWSSMTSSTTTGNTAWTGFCLVYIPMTSDIGVAQSWTSDRIYYKTSSTTLASNILYYYNVSTNAWTSVATSDGGITVDSADGSSLAWDGKNRLYAMSGKSIKLRVFDLVAGTWSIKDNATLPSISDPYGPHIDFLDCYQNQIVVDKTNTTYWMFGDEDHIKIITKDSTGKYWFFYGGEIDSFYATNTVQPSSTISAGPNVSFAVTGSTAQFVVGQPLYIYDPVAGGKAESFTLTAKTTGSLTGTLLNSYSTSARIGVDPQTTIVYANKWNAAHVVQTSKGPGCFTNNNSSPNTFGQEMMVSLLPQDRGALSSSMIGARGHLQLMPVIAAHVPGDSPGSLQAGRTMRPELYGNNQSDVIGKYAEYNYGSTGFVENRGQLHGVFAGKKTISPDPVSEDEIVVGTDTYIVFKTENLFNSYDFDLNIIVGPK